MTTEFAFFQLDNGIVGGSTGGVAEQGRPFDKRMSNFGDLASTPVNVFKAKDELSNALPDTLDQLANTNPLVWGSTVKHVKNDTLVLMGLGSVYEPGADVNDRKDANAGTYYLPQEGWRSLGGKNDTARDYQGSRLRG